VNGAWKARRSLTRTPTAAGNLVQAPSDQTCIVAGSSFDPDGLRLTATENVNPRFAGVITRESFAAPMRIDLVVRPFTQLRLVFGRHNQYRRLLRAAKPSGDLLLQCAALVIREAP
jgi:hypothetical protein